MFRFCTQCDVTTWPDTTLSGPLNNPFGGGKGFVLLNTAQAAGIDISLSTVDIKNKGF